MSFAYWIPVLIGAVIFVFGIILISGVPESPLNYYDSLINGLTCESFLALAPTSEPGALITGGWKP